MRKVNLEYLVSVNRINDDILLGSVINSLSKDILNTKRTKMTTEIEKIKEEISCISSLIEELNLSINYLNDFFYGYTINNISKEFDLLKIGNSILINIELKLRDIPRQRIHRQLKMNKYYLNSLSKHGYFFTYINETNSLYKLSKDDILIESSFDELRSTLLKFNDSEINEEFDIVKEFKAKKFIVSPFNDTTKFLNDEYFLNGEQNEVKNDILKNLSNKKVIFISGYPGTGKSLLVYDLYKNLTGRKLIVHCGMLNTGHEALIREGWEIKPIKEFIRNDYSDKKYDYIFMDEVQRIKKKQFDHLFCKIKKVVEKNVIMSGDPNQWLHIDEVGEDLDRYIKSIGEHSIYKVKKLTNRIRCNNDLKNFIKLLFDLNDKQSNISFDKVQLLHFDNYEKVNKFIEENNQFKNSMIINYTKSNMHKKPYDKFFDNKSINSHEVLGQEFDQIVITIDRNFEYNSDNQLVYNGSYYYNPLKMLFQMVSRGIENVTLIVVNNEELFSKLFIKMDTGFQKKMAE